MKELLFFLPLFFLPSLLYPETIKLKNGKIVEAKIIQRSSNYLKVDLAGVILTYYSDEIESIDGVLWSKEPLPLTYQTFKDERRGISFVYPSDWETFSDGGEGRIISIRPKGEEFFKLLFLEGRVDLKFREGLTWEELLGEVKPYGDSQVVLQQKNDYLGKEKGYLIRYIKRSALSAQAKGRNELLTPHCELYYFSDFFSSQGKDRRLFIVQVLYLKYEPSFIQGLKLEEGLSQGLEKELKEFNILVEKRLIQAREIVNSFSYKKLELEGLSGEQDDYLKKGLEYFRQNKYPEAIAEFKKALLKEEKEIIYLYLGSAYRELKSLEEARDAFEKALGINPNSLEANLGLAGVWQSLGEKRKALEYYQRALRLDPSSFQIYTNIGFVYLELSQFKEARDFFKKAVELQPASAEAHYGLGYTYVFLEDYKNARLHLEKAKIFFRQKGKQEESQATDELLRRLPY